MPIEGPTESSQRGLRRMKRTAGLCLAVAAAVFVATTAIGGLGTAGGYVQAASEAAMVGGLADWFAVTALFRRPLGVPVPHTALVPRKKDELATKLGEFVTGYFLTPEVLAAQVAESGIVERVGSWLADPAHAESVARDVAATGAEALGAMDRGVVVDYVVELLRRDQARRSYAPVIGGLLSSAIDVGAPEPLVELLAGRAASYVANHEAELAPTVKRFVEDRHWVAWIVTTDRLIAKLLRDTVSELAAIEGDPDHPFHVALRGLLRSVADDLRTDPETAATVDRLAAKLLADPQTEDAIRDLVSGGIESVRAALADADGTLVARIAALVGDLGRRAAGDADFHDAVEGWLRAMVTHVVVRYGGEVTALIRRQVSAWPAAEASRRIELAVGRDLQYIRINGTVVGALAGLAIHAVALGIA